MAEIQFPASTAPGVNAMESGGRLINAYAEKAPVGSRSAIIIRRAPGLRTMFSTTETTARGGLLVGSVLYIVSGDKVSSVTKSGTTYSVTELTGTVGGTGPVYMSRNMNTSPQLLIVHSDGMSAVDLSGGSVAAFSDADLPAGNSICFMDGYFIVTIADGRAFASDINATGFNALNYTTAESSPDGLVRGVAFGRDLLLMGTTTIEFFGNTGNPTGFPFSRGPVLPVGLLAPQAVAGFEAGFPEPLVWIGNDRTVRRLNGYTPERISSPELERLIEAVTDTSELECSVYVAAGHPCCVISSATWSWAYDFSTNEWHERQSYGATLWRAHYGVNAFDEWLTFDRDSGKVFKVDATYRREDGGPLVWETRSTQTHAFPSRAIVDRASFDFVTGVGVDAGIDPIETDPQVSISWSDDGGRTFGNALLRRLGSQGETTTVDIRRLGMTGSRGRQYRLQVSDPVEVALMGGAQDIGIVA